MEFAADPPLPTPQTFVVNGVVIDLRTETLFQPSGDRVALRPQAFAMLRFLIANPNRIVTKDELIQEIWHGAAVTDDSLVQCVREIRRALGDRHRASLQTAPRRGYRMVLSPEAQFGAPSAPSIAVLPFENLSGNPDQDYFADGMVEEITTALSRIRWLSVIARNSSFVYKGRALDVRHVARELGVRYVLAGSVRRAADRVRITGHLIDGSTGAHLWADRFDGETADVFELQDKVTSSVVGAIAPRVEQAEIERAKRKPTDSLDAYDFYLRGLAAFHLFTREGHEQATAYFQKAIQADPGFASALGMAARCYLQRQGYGWVADRAAEMAAVVELARQAADAGKEDAVALSSAGLALAAVAHEISDGAALVERALALNPNLAWAWLSDSWMKIYLGKPELAIERATKAMHLSPHDPQLFAMQTALAAGHFFAGRESEALSWAQVAMREQPKFFVACCVAAASAGLAAQRHDAKRAMTQLRRLNPGLSISNLHTLFPLQTRDFDRWTEGLRRAGLPEHVQA